MAVSGRDVIINLTELGNIIAQMSREFISKRLAFYFFLLLFNLFAWH